MWILVLPGSGEAAIARGLLSAANPTVLRIDQDLDKLPSSYADVMRLVRDGFTHSEIAERLGIPVGTVRSRMTKAADTLRADAGAANSGAKSRVLWSDEAEADLENINPVVKDRLRRNAEVILPDFPALHRQGPRRQWRDHVAPTASPMSRNVRAKWLWEEDDDGTQAWDYYLFYRRRSPTEFEVLGVRSTRQMAAGMGVQMTSEPGAAG